MNIYTIGKDLSGKIRVRKPDLEPLQIEEVLLTDASFFKNKYGLEMSSVEHDLFHAHYTAWTDFKDSESEYCAIVEEGVQLNVRLDLVVSEIKAIKEDWDILFPYDKVRTDQHRNPIGLSHFGFYWGYHFYIINKVGVSKLLNFQSIQQPLDEQILDAALKKQLTIYAGDSNWFSFDETASISYVSRHDSVISYIQNYTVWEKRDKETALEILKYIKEKAEEVKVEVGLHAGTLLGAIRHGKIMDWDDDIDLIVCQDDVDALLNGIREAGKFNITKWVWKKTGEPYYKIWDKNGKYVDGYEYAFPFVDIWTYKNSDGDIITNDGYCFKSNEYLPFRNVDFESSDFLCPQNSRVVLDTMYKGWDGSIKIFSWSHKVKQHINTKVSTQILTNTSGRLVKYL